MHGCARAFTIQIELVIWPVLARVKQSGFAAINSIKVSEHVFFLLGAQRTLVKIDELH